MIAVSLLPRVPMRALDESLGAACALANALLCWVLHVAAFGRFHRCLAASAFGVCKFRV